MATVFRCDICRLELGDESATLSITLGAMQITLDPGARFGATGRPNQYLLCLRCGDGVDRTVDSLRRRLPSSVPR